MNSELNALHARLERLEQDNAQIKTRFHAAQRRLRIHAGLAFLLAVFLSPANRAVIAQGYGVTLQQLNTRLMAVEAKTQYQSVNTTAKSTTFSGCNVYIQSGRGVTNDGVDRRTGLSGLGNLIIGYNALRNGGGNTRTGSHNLILGDENNYSSYGGLVAGSDNSITGAYASITGGQSNTASGDAASVSGGSNNTASGDNASVSGGFQNTVSGNSASISGGQLNIASGGLASVSGGFQNTASGPTASVSGGFQNKASGDSSSVTGGQINTASSFAASISGGQANKAEGSSASVSGGLGILQSAGFGWSAGGASTAAYHSP